jgi:hypothetical protein
MARTRFALVVSIAISATVLCAGSAHAATLCVGGGPACFTTIQEAVDAAGDGDRISVRPGTYAGGITIDEVSVDIVGAGSDRTVVRGGGPVFTIGTFGASAASEPTVSIARMRIAGGVTRSSPESVPFTGEEGVFVNGGAISIPPDEDFSGATTVTVRDSVIAGNRVAPTETVPTSVCPGCTFAMAAGGGIGSWGTLRVIGTAVRNNQVGTASGLSTLASDADGGGVASFAGSVTLIRSVVSGNAATATGPEGRFAEGGGIFANGDAITMRESAVTNNHAALVVERPNTVEQLAIGGGVQIGDVPTFGRISDSTISDNSIEARSDVADAIAFSGGVNMAADDMDFVMRDTMIARNEANALVVGGSGFADGDTGGASLVGRVLNTRVVDNRATARSTGDALAAAGGLFTRGLLADSAVNGNVIKASAPHGGVQAAGAGIVLFRSLTLRGTTVRANMASASGPDGVSQGGGIFDAPLFSNGGALTLVDSEVIHNVATGTPRITLHGGGIYIPERRLTLVRSTIGDNVPDQVAKAVAGRTAGAAAPASRMR